MFCVQVLIVGGGNGGVAREVAKYPLVETIDLVEIDRRIVELSKIYLPFMAEGLNSPKLNLHIYDGIQFMKNRVQYYDVIITDSLNLIGNNSSPYLQYCYIYIYIIFGNINLYFFVFN